MAATHAKTSMYNEQDIERCLRVMALSGGSSHEAKRRLDSQGYRCPDDSTLRQWRRERYTERYRVIREEVTPELIERAAAEAEDLTLRIAEGERLAVDKTIEEIPHMKGAEAATALRNLTTSKALQVDKISSPLRGRPVVVIEHRSTSDLETKLRRVLGAGVVNGTAQEVPPSHQLDPASPEPTRA